MEVEAGQANYGDHWDQKMVDVLGIWKGGKMVIMREENKDMWKNMDDKGKGVSLIGKNMDIKLDKSFLHQHTRVKEFKHH